MLCEIDRPSFFCGGEGGRCNSELFHSSVCQHKIEKEEQERECYFKHEKIMNSKRLKFYYNF